jgi:ATP dependent DNA ligase C terminal region
MKYLRLDDRIRNLCATVAITLIFPALAYAGTDNGKGNGGQNNGNQNGHKVPVVPEANAGWVLVPFFGVVLLLSARQLFRQKVTE